MSWPSSSSSSSSSLPVLSEFSPDAILMSIYCFEGISVRVSLRPNHGVYSIEIAFIFENYYYSAFNIEQFEEFRSTVFSLDANQDFFVAIIGEYNISFHNGMLTILKDDDDEGKSGNVPYTRKLDFWKRFLHRLHTALNYKFHFLEKYCDYATLVHGRVVNFYVNMLCESDDVEFFNPNFLCDHLINLDSSLLPKNSDNNEIAICDYSTLDFTVCNLINSELRLNMSSIIYLDIYMIYLEHLLE